MRGYGAKAMALAGWLVVGLVFPRFGSAQGRDSGAAPKIGAATVGWICRLGPGGGCVPQMEGPPTEDPVRWFCPTCTAGMLVMSAFGLDNIPQIKKEPGWMNSDAYQVEVTTTSPATHAQMMSLLQGVVVKAFGLRYHIEEPPAPVCKLVVARGGPKFRRTDKKIAMTRDALMAGFYDFGSVTDLVDWLNRFYYVDANPRHPVEDATGLKGRFDIRLTLGEGTLVNRAPLIDLVQKQLGLKAIVVPGHTKYLTIDAITRLRSRWLGN